MKAIRVAKYGEPEKLQPSARSGHATAGLCAGCEFARLVVSARGSQFILCERSATDPAFPKYPRLPVIECAGYSPRSNS